MHSTESISIAPINVNKTVRQATLLIQSMVPARKPELAIICGSGLGSLADQLTDATTISYQDIPGFPVCSVAGHEGQLVLGRLAGREVMCLMGRPHLYEGGNVAVIRSFIRTIKGLGVKALFITSAVGSLRTSMQPGSLITITDHINFQIYNPLLGGNEDDFGPRFVGLEDCYHPQLRSQLQQAAQTTNIPLHQGVFIATLGPSFETPAEIRAFSLLGADVVGMSVVPEVIVAKHCQLPTAVVSVVTNLASGMSDQTLSHATTLEGAAKGTDHLIQLSCQFIQDFNPAPLTT